MASRAANAIFRWPSRFQPIHPPTNLTNANVSMSFPARSTAAVPLPRLRAMIQSWSLSSLVGAYLDLALAYLLLCGATLAFAAAKFLSLFGLALPCTCDGLFGQPRRCLHRRLLVDRPADTIASVHASLLARFPFDSFLLPPLLDKASSSNSSEQDLILPPPLGSKSSGEDKPPPSIPRRRRRRSHSSSPPSSALGELDHPPSKCPFTDFPSNTSNDHIGAAAPVNTLQYYATITKDASSSPASHSCGSTKPEAVIIEGLERELQQEQAARAALYLELDKERSAAASATDEAMAMILRLQKEKGEIEMEARQYRRMVEEKSAYDEEEMDILKEIIVRREREKHFFEKKVEVYRQMMLSDGRPLPPLVGDLQLMPRSTEDPTLMLQQICESMGKYESIGHLGEDASSQSHGDVKQVFDNKSDHESNVEFQEKGMVTMEVYPSPIEIQLSSYEEDSNSNMPKSPGCHVKTPPLVIEQECTGDSKTEVTVPFEDLYRESNQYADQRSSDSSHFEVESRIHDVHVVDDKLNLEDGIAAKRGGVSQTGLDSNFNEEGGPTVQPSGTSILDRSSNSSVPSWVGVNQNVRRSCSDMTRGEQMDHLCDKPLVFDLRRNSMSAVDTERFKLETEVELLRKRLKIIQQGRDKLSFSVDNREKESFQLQLLDEIARQLQELGKITEPDRSTRGASLPPSSSKVNTNKRRCRSVSWGLQDSA